MLRLAALAFGGSVWLFARLFATETTAEQEMVDAFFHQLATPVDIVREVYARGVRETSSFGLVGGLTMGIGCLVWILSLFPSGRSAWWASAGLGAVLLTIGWLMFTFGRRSERIYSERMREAVAALPDCEGTRTGER
ncbi:MAG: hypothetical protein QGI83_00055 [Candidatus Latescibacteria bacterium]|nr:hypothetical protein [Candidatus Latescibacterota bacterium]